MSQQSDTPSLGALLQERHAKCAVVRAELRNPRIVLKNPLN